MRDSCIDGDALFPSPASGRVRGGVLSSGRARGPHPTSRSLSSGRPKAGPVGSATLPESGCRIHTSLEPQFGAVLDALEVVETPAHHLGTGLTVVAGPSSEPGDHPRAKGERALRMGVLLARSTAFKLSRHSLENGLIGRLEGQVACRSV